MRATVIVDRSLLDDDFAHGIDRRRVTDDEAATGTRKSSTLRIRLAQASRHVRRNSPAPPVAIAASADNKNMIDPTHPLAELLRRDSRYHLDAYVFVFDAYVRP